MLYGPSKTPLSSINILTTHDGFCLRDLVSFQKKHNYLNGEENRDGIDQNDSWNCGHEGPTNNKKIQQLRQRQMRNFFLALFLAQGIPLLLMGDEYGHTRNGNNNPYVQDNPISWFLWDELENNKQIFHFVSKLIQFRKKHPQLRKTHFLTSDDIHWHSSQPFQTDWSHTSHFVAFTLKGDKEIFVAFNAGHKPAPITLPSNSWRLVIRTDQDWQFFEQGEPLPQDIILPSYSSLLAIQST